MSMQKLNQMISISGANEGKALDAGLGGASMVGALSGDAYRNSLVEQTRKQNIGANLWQILNKYNAAGSFLRNITEIIHKVNNDSIVESNPRTSAQAKAKEGGDEHEPLVSDRREQRFEKQARVNSNQPTRSGVISSPDPRQQNEIQRVASPDPTLRNQVPKAGGNVSGFDHAAPSSAPSSSRGSVGSEDFVTEESEAHHKFNDNEGVNINRR